MDKVPYRLQKNEPVAAGVKRIVSEETASAAGQLANSKAPQQAEAIHEARKSVKKIRGVLRLVQPELDGAYRAEVARWRELGHSLAAFRDADAMVETYDNLRKKYSGEIPRGALNSMRRALVKRSKEAARSNRAREVMQKVADGLTEGGLRACQWPLKEEGFDAIGPGIERTFKRGAKAFRLASKLPTPVNLHDWRKRVKEHWYQIRLLEDRWTGKIKKRESRLKDLEDALGEDHNLVVLLNLIKQNSRLYGTPETLRLFRRLANRYQKELRKEALSLGEDIYKEKPSEFIKRIEQLWE
jgi:CHAD domain-containing protein